jgi:hypothetical protein
MRLIKAAGALVMMIIGVTAIARADEPSIELLQSTTMPAIQIANQPLEKVLQQLKAAIPGFRYVIYRAPLVSKDYPILPAIQLQGVAIDQFITLINNECPNVKITVITDGWAQNPPLLEVDITSGSTTQPATTQPSVVRVFGLAELIAYRSIAIEGVEKREDRDKQASNEILSMIQAALDVSGDPTVPVMKLHGPTKTLIFKGTDAQAQIVESAIKALHTGDGVAINLERQTIDQLGSKVQKLTDENQQLGYEAQKYEQEERMEKAMRTRVETMYRELNEALATAKKSGGEDSPTVKQLQAMLAEFNDHSGMGVPPSK